MKKFLICLLLITLLTVSLVACGGDDPETPSGTDSATGEEITSELVEETESSSNVGGEETESSTTPESEASEDEIWVDIQESGAVADETSWTDNR